MKVLDLFAGTGVGVAVKSLGWDDLGVELDTDVVNTRTANGLTTLYRDVWDSEKAEGVEFDLLWGSPPCQTFSTTGNGSGVRALNDVLGMLSTGAYRDVSELKAASARFEDSRTGLVLTPMHYIHRFRPIHVALEQVPAALPVWDAMKPHLEALGYQVWTGKLDAVNYGVPQNRVRAVLMASKQGLRKPVETSSHLTLRSIRPDQEGLISNYSHNGPGGYKIPGNKRPRGFRKITEPGFTATSKVTSQKWHPSLENMTIGEAKKLQGYPEEFTFTSNARLQIGNAVPPPMARAILESFI